MILGRNSQIKQTFAYSSGPKRSLRFKIGMLLWGRLACPSAKFTRCRMAVKKTKSHKREALRLRPIGVIRSNLRTRNKAPKQGYEGAPDAWLEIKAFAAQCLDGLKTGTDIIAITWLHNARRDVLKVHPRSDPNRPLTGVFATRSPDRPNPLGLHRVTIRRVVKNRLRIGPIEAIDGTPVVDIKPVLSVPHDF